MRPAGINNNMQFMTLQEKYLKEVVPAMMAKFGYKNRLAVPQIKKVVLNAGFGKAIAVQKGQTAQKMLAEITRDLSLICGQKPVITLAKKSIAGFKVRQGQKIGAKVTLRRKRMYDFLTRLINVALPRSRDFKGLPAKSLDEQGNLTIGIKEQSVFPEVPSDKISFLFGFEVTVVTGVGQREEALELYKLLGFPIKF
jgi:large subunit ribosomal protein L5